jgi:protein-export membrane protein SecD
MTRVDLWKLVGVALVTVMAGWILSPSWRFYSLSPAERQRIQPTELARLRREAVHLGLDLQGGMHLVLEVDRSHMNAAEGRDAVDRAMEVLRRRIDEFGVAEPVVQKEGEDRIVIQLPGLTDRQRAMELIGKTALLEFKLVRTPDESKGVFTRIDAYLAAHGASRDTAAGRAPLASTFQSLGIGAFVRNEDLPTATRLLATAGLDSVIPSDSQLLWSSPNESEGNSSGQYLYVVKREPEMTGGSVATADASNNVSSTRIGEWGVSMELTPKGRADFARVTGANVNRNLAIVLDGQVASAPNIIQRIHDGRASITGSFTVQSAKDLSIVLRAGALPAPVKVIEERSVGPSLGADSIHEGLMAGLVGTLLVVVFMAVYYQLSGLIAIVAMVLNIFYLIAGLAGMHFTLTLPGIAGIVLTIGMSVDANVLIFERIREELRNGRSVRQAVQTGYDRAFRTILDAHVTTLISAFFLYYFGTGPIRGFAVSLGIGLVANMFTAVLFTRMVFDFMLDRSARTERLSI